MEKLKLDTIYQVLNNIEKRPAMFLGNERTFQSLDAFINGLSINAKPSFFHPENENDFSNFSIWLLGHINPHFGLSAGWFWQIWNKNNKDNNKSFEDFFSLIKTFKDSTQEKSPVSIYPKTQNWTTISSTGTKERQEQITTLEKVKYSNSNTIWLLGYSSNKEIIYEQWFIDKEELEETIKKEFQIKN